MDSSRERLSISAFFQYQADVDRPDGTGPSYSIDFADAQPPPVPEATLIPPWALWVLSHGSITRCPSLQLP